MLFQGQEFSRVGAVPVFRRPRAGAGARRCARAAREFLAQFPSLADYEAARQLARSRRRRRRSSAASSISASAQRMRRAYALHRDLLRLRRERRRVRAQRAGGVDGAVLAAHGLRAALLRRGSRRRSPADRQPRARSPAGRRSPSRCWRRRRPRLGGALVERGSDVRRQRHAGALARRRLAHPGRDARSSCAGPRSEQRRTSGDVRRRTA